MNNVAKFLEARGQPEAALELATDGDYRFDLAVQLGDLQTALDLATAADSEAKWKQLGELAMTAGRLDVRARQGQVVGGERGGLLSLSAVCCAGSMCDLPVHNILILYDSSNHCEKTHDAAFIAEPMAWK